MPKPRSKPVREPDSSPDTSVPSTPKNPPGHHREPWEQPGPDPAVSETIAACLAELPDRGLGAGGARLLRGLDFPIEAGALALIAFASGAARAHDRRVRLRLLSTDTLENCPCLRRW